MHGQFYEFFAGGGMARLGLPKWECLAANDIGQIKAASYVANFGGEHLIVSDVASLTTADLPGRADLVWLARPASAITRLQIGRGLKKRNRAPFGRAGN
jgi:DNA (cytosine-5)-methyltransferase 1